MKVGIMQPYFLPYIGYWQLMNAVDRYVIYDDVNFIKRTLSLHDALPIMWGKANNVPEGKDEWLYLSHNSWLLPQDCRS